MNHHTLDPRSIELRTKIVNTLSISRRGHLAPAFSLVEILRVLYDDVLHYDAKNPALPQRDRFILSKGHGCLALYALLADKGFFPNEELSKFCSMEGMLGGHPEHHIPGVEASTGSLGHGLSIGVGFALAAKMDASPAKTFVVVGDGECNEGSIWEAALSAAKHRLDKLTVIIDYNKLQSYGSVAEIMPLESLADKWRSFGFGVSEVDGHSVSDLQQTFATLPLQTHKPNAIICHTTKGKGIPFMENDLAWHHKSSMSDEVFQSLLDTLEAYHA